MRTLAARVTGVLVSTGLVATFAAASGAGADTTSGVGTGQASTTVLRVQLGNGGSLLNLRVLGDDGTSTIDNKVATPSGVSRLTPLSVSSGVGALSGPLATLNNAVPSRES